jgi:hypothetical protein
VCIEVLVEVEQYSAGTPDTEECISNSCAVLVSIKLVKG